MINVNILNAAVFIAVAVLHVVRLLTGAEAVIGGTPIAPWLSAVAVAGSVILAWWNLKALPKLGKAEILRLVAVLALIDGFICFYSWIAGLSYWGFSAEMFLSFVVFDLVLACALLHYAKRLS